MSSTDPLPESSSSSPLTSHTVPTIPPSISYIPDFLDPTQESTLLTQIHSRPWIELSARRLQVYPAQLTSRNVLLSRDPLPPWLLEPLQFRFDTLGVFAGVKPDGGDATWNHCLVNNYKPGEGIMPHEDGPAYYPVTATVSLGGHTVLEVVEKSAGDGREGEGEEGRKWRILQEPRSLLVTRGEAYSVTVHGIRNLEVDEELEGVANWELVGEKERYTGGSVRREERTSLTCRSVVKVSTLGSKMFGKR